MDRFVGTLAPVFRASRLDVDLHYNPPGIRGEPRYLEGVARFTKLHGSVDWVDCDRAIRRIGLPFGAAETKPYLAAAGVDGAGPLRLMIYPNAAKDRETGFPPLRRAVSRLCCRDLPAEQHRHLLRLWVRRRAHQSGARGHADDPVDPPGRDLA